MGTPIKPYADSGESKKDQVARMFNSISERYDLLNRVLSMGIDKVWRKKAIGLLRNNKPKTILDVATGTGDFAIEALSLNPEHITGIDISTGMLEEGRKKLEKLALTDRITLIHGDSENLPFDDHSFDASTVAFGVRNFENLHKGLSQINRVLKPGGKLVVLEFSKPQAFPIKQIYNFYFNNILPFIGRLVSKDSSAYQYLPESVKAFPEGKDFLDAMKKAGFIHSEQKRLTFGICSIYTGIKP